MINQAHILFITKHDPYSTGGGCYATHAYLRAFSVVFDGKIDICVADHCKPFKEDVLFEHVYRVKKRSQLHRLLSFVTGDMHRYTMFVKHLLRKNRGKYTFCVFDHNVISGTLVKYVNKCGIKTITIHHNYEPDYYKANESSNLMKVLLLPQIKRIEKIAYKNSYLNLFLTMDDLNMFESIYGKSKGKNKLIGCFEASDYSINKINHRVNEFPVFIITGSLNRIETKESLRFFFSELYEEIPSVHKIIIAGRNPDSEIIKWCHSYPNVHLISNPANMHQIVNKADIYLSVNHLGGGLKLRLMDGFSNGLPVIAHKTSARGYQCFFESNVLYVFEDKLSFRDSIKQVLSKYQKNVFSKDDIQTIYNDSFSFNAGVERLQKLLAE